MKKVVLLMMLILIGLSACATAPSIPKGAKSSEVTFYFYGNDLSALTFWRKINDDGSKGKRFSVGGTSQFGLIMNSGFKKPFEENINLEAGTYFLDSFQVSTKDGFVVSQGKNYALRNGWDDDNKKPLYMSFTVEEGKDLILPRIEIIPIRSENGYEIVSFRLSGGDASALTFGSLVQVDISTSSVK